MNIIENLGFKKPSAAVSSLNIARIVRYPIVLILIALILVLLLVDPKQFAPTIAFTLNSLWQILPFLLLAVSFAAFIKASNADVMIARVFAGNPVRSILMAAFFGALSPFCSCGVIPLIAAMLGAGVPLAPVMAFWIASPIMDPEMFILTAAGIGTDFAIAKTVATIMMGLFAGFSVLLLQRGGALGNPLKANVGGGCVSTCKSKEEKVINYRFWREAEMVGVFKSETIKVGIFLGKWLTFAFFIESLMVAYISSEFIVDYVGADNPFAIPLAALIGVPSYLNGYAAIPLVSGLIDMGITPGAAMSFMTAGAVSSIPAAIAVFALVRKTVFGLYLGLGLIGSIFVGWLYEVSGVLY